jgi:hypothetical protein
MRNTDVRTATGALHAPSDGLPEITITVADFHRAAWASSLGSALETVSTVIAIAIALACGAWGMFGAQGALLPELFGAQHRYIGVSVAREASAVLAGGIAPFVGAALIGLGNNESRFSKGGMDPYRRLCISSYHDHNRCNVLHTRNKGA